MAMTPRARPSPLKVSCKVSSSLMPKLTSMQASMTRPSSSVATTDSSFRLSFMPCIILGADTTFTPTWPFWDSALINTSWSGPTFSQLSVCGPMAAKSPLLPPPLLLPTAVREARKCRKPGPRGRGRPAGSKPMCGCIRCVWASHCQLRLLPATAALPPPVVAPNRKAQLMAGRDDDDSSTSNAKEAARARRRPSNPAAPRPIAVYFRDKTSAGPRLPLL